MEILDGRYERLRLLLEQCLVAAEREYREAVLKYGRKSPAIAALEDDMDEWALLIHELDAAAPEHLRREIGTDDWRP